MPLETNLSRSPYFNDYDETKDYYGVLFKPSVAVQARELNQLQTILQKQIERFGDHVFKSGTIISGVNFRYLPNYQYVKILDLQVDGQTATPSAYEGLYTKNSANLVARIVKSASGYEQKDPDLNTLYLQYVNSSDTGNTAVYANGEVLTVYSRDNPLYSVSVDSGGLNFSNSDTLVVVSALSVNTSSGTFTNGEVITQATTGARAQIVEVNAIAIANSLVLKVKPLTADLANTSANSSKWSFSSGYNITGNTSSAVANVVTLVGSGATGVVTTDSLGVVSTITVQTGGNNYTVAPYVTIKPTNNTASLSTLSLTGRTYKAQVTIANSSFTAPVGNGYAFSVTEGVIYQKGFFLRVTPQVILIDKYTSSPNNVVVGFKTTEATSNVNLDSSLYDNALGTTNFGAPGADRLKLVPELVTLSSANAAANVEFFALAEFKNGDAYKENRNTVYNILGKEFARRTSETNGDFVIDEFLVITKDQDTTNTAYNSVIVDPGLAYISGERIQTLRNTYLDIRKSTDTATQSNQVITANFGNYVRVKNLAGVFNFKAGDTVSLRSSAASFVGGINFPSGTSISPSGSEVGTARMRSLVYESGEPGTPDATYRLYLFDIKMNPGRAFKDVLGFFYNGTNDGIADAVQEYNATTTANETILKDTDNNRLLFATGLKAVKVANDVSFTYRTTNEAVTLNANGMLTISLITSGEQFPYTGDTTLDTTQKQDIVVVPLANAESSANISGTIAVTSSSNTITGTTTSFASELAVGDYIKISANTTGGSDIRRITNIANNTSLQLDANVSFANTSARAKKFFPSFYPIPVASRSSRVVNTGSSATTLKIHLNETFSSPVTAAVTYNVRRTSATESTKSVNRDAYVKLYTANNAGGINGPWCLGLPDAVRLKNVYLGNTASGQDVTKHFYIDQGHDGNFYGQSYLVQKGTSELSLANTQWLLVKLDAYTSSTEGFLTVGSYNVDDTKTLAASSNTVNTLEIPEVITSDKHYYDLRDTFDFRPRVSNTVAIATSVGSAPINPANTESFNSNDKLFPAPDSQIVFDAEYYLGRVDRVVAKKDGTFEVIEGSSDLVNPRPPQKPIDSVTLSLVTNNPYPTLPMVLGDRNLEFANKAVGNELGEITNRLGNYSTRISTTQFEDSAQTRTYKMADIGVLEKRIDQLEYYVSLNLLETKVKDLVIPSSVNPAVNRFKNGFFVDNFDDYSFAEQSSKEFNCKIEQTLSELHPRTKQYNLDLIFDRTDATTNGAIFSNKSILLPHVEEVLVKQDLATSTVNSDGNKTNYGGDMIIAPGSFRLLVRGEVEITPDPVPPSGGDGGGGGRCRVICTHMTEMGEMAVEDLAADLEFTKRLSEETILGYHAWAFGIVRHMRHNPESSVTEATKWIARQRTEEIKYQLGKTEKSNWAGKYIRLFGEMFCWGLGTLINNLGVEKVKTQVERDSADAMEAMKQASMAKVAAVYNEVQK